MLEHLNMQTPDGVETNIEKIAALFPSAVTEMRAEDGTVKKGINFEALKQLLSHDIVDGKEHYEFTWVGKKQAMAEAARPTTQTLRPVQADSRSWDTTGNLYLEGDNLEVLKILQQSYLGKVKMIYIDPPYNTGKDFIYPDAYQMPKDRYDNLTNKFDENGNVNYSYVNTAANERYHSDWCSMIYKRLVLAKNLLANNGAIFISIDDNEIDSLKQICDIVFGEDNFVAQFPWQSRQSMQNDTDISVNNEYVVAYAKRRRTEERRLKESNADKWYTTPSFCFLPLPLSIEAFDNPDNDPRGPWKADPFDAPNVRVNLTYKIKNPNTGEEFLPPKGRHWRTEETTYKKLLQDNRIVFGKNGASRPQLKVFYEEKKRFGSIDTTWWTGEKCGTTTQGTKEQMQLFDGIAPFDTPKPIKMIRQILQLVSLPDSNDIVLDFFSGSATTAHAVMQLNAEDGGHRKFIMVQLPEPCDEKSEAYKAGYKNICEIGKERIRRAGDKIKAEHPDADVDTGFRVFKVDSSNMKEVYFHPEEVTQTMLGETVSNIKPDRTDLDLLYDCMLRCGVEIDLPHTTTLVDDCKVHNVDNGALMACFDANVPESVVHAMAAQQPIQAIFRDSSFATDAEKINVAEIFKNLSPDTKVRVI